MLRTWTWRPRTLAIIVGGVAALAITGAAIAHPGLRLVDRVDVLARALGISADEVEQAKDDGTLHDLVGDLSIDDLSEAYTTAAEEAIDEALAAGAITPEQAERLGALQASPRPFGRFGGLEGSDREACSELRDVSAAIRIDVVPLYADVLGLTVVEVEAAIEDHTIRELLADVDPVVLSAALVEARAAAIDAALAAGDITAEQAELLRDSSFGGFRGGFGRGGFHGPRGGFGHFGSRPDGSSSDSDTSISI